MRQHINRRLLLKASGVSLALPLLECMSPANASDVQPPQRLVFICTALGLHPPHLWPTTVGRDYENTPYLELLREHRNDFTLFSGLEHEDQTGRQPHDSEMTFLTSARRPGTGGFRNTISVDQLAAGRIGNQTRFSSVTLGTMKPQSQSYTPGGVMIPAETSPATIFARMFLNGRPDEVKRQKQELAAGRSILDQLGAEVRSLRTKSSNADNHLLEDYFSSVRQAEKNIAATQGWMETPKPKVDEEPPTDIPDPADLIGRMRLLLELIPLMVQTDSTRVVSVMVQDHFVVPIVEGVTGNHHNLSHHGQDPTKIAQLQRIETEILTAFADLLQQMKSKREGESPLLRNTSVLFGSNLGNANAHHARNLPIFLAGGPYEHGQYAALSEGTPLCNLFVRMLNESGLETEAFGQSTAVLNW